MQAISIPEVIKSEGTHRTEWTVGGYRVTMLLTVAGWQVICVRRGEVISRELDIMDTKEDALEVAEAWIEAAVEAETEWED